MIQSRKDLDGISNARNYNATAFLTYGDKFNKEDND